MKTTGLILVLLATAAHAVSFDTPGYGRWLNGWQPDGAAHYSLAGGNYRTLVPLLAPAEGGGLSLTTRIDHLLGCKPVAFSTLDLTFNSAGLLDSAQVRGEVGGRSFDTGPVRRPQPPPPVEGGETAPVPAPGGSTAEVVDDLLSRLAAEFEKVEADENVKRDLLSRIFGAEGSTVAVATGVRHNLALIVRHVGP